MIKVDQKNRIPKYKQIVQEILKNIKNGNMKHGDQLPSINELRDKLNVARDTVIKAYKELTTTGVISSMPGKGYYISKNIHEIEHKIFIMFDLFLANKQTIFNSFMENIGDNALIDIYFHHYNKNLYKKLLLEAVGQYTDYIVMPLEDPSGSNEWFDNLVKNQNVYILDVGLVKYGYRYPSVCQDFRSNWYNSLADVQEKLQKYQQIVMVNYKKSVSKYTEPHDNEMLAGFVSFCKDFDFEYSIIDQKENLEVNQNFCYVISNDDVLVQMIKEAREKEFELGVDVGFISHNDTPLKSVVGRNGITTISTDFYEMGRKMAEMINSGDKDHHINPAGIIDRDSI